MIACIMRDNRSFQSTPPRGGRQQAPSEGRYPLISIHAPAWGATPRSGSASRRSKFQSTPPRGGRQKQIILRPPLIYFNPRPRVGGDRCRAALTCRPAHFNPRPRVGGRRYLRASIQAQFISIHAPAWGATSIRFRPPLSDTISIHAPAWGATKRAV